MNDKRESDVLIIGGVAAGPKTAATLARRSPELRITLLEKGDFDMRYACISSLEQIKNPQIKLVLQKALKREGEAELQELLQEILQGLG